jgi:uncharacterized protein YkwD
MDMCRSIYRSIIVVSLLLVTFALDAFPQRAYYSSGENEVRILSLINRERAKNGLAQLVWNDRLGDLARRYSEKMARENFFEHIDSDGNDVVARARQSRIRGWRKIGENLFTCDPTDDFTSLSVRGWMRSPSHRQNILDPEWRDTGIGIAFSRRGEIYITEIFADN